MFIEAQKNRVETQKAFLDSLPSNEIARPLSGMIALFDCDDVLFPGTAEMMFTLFRNLIHVCPQDERQLRRQYQNPGKWKEWDKYPVTKDMIKTLYQDETILKTLGINSPIVGERTRGRNEINSHRLIRLFKVFSLDETLQFEIVNHYPYNPQDWPGWENKTPTFTGRIINNLVRELFSTERLHFLLKPDNVAKDVLDLLKFSGLQPVYHSSRRGAFFLHDETLLSIERADFPDGNPLHVLTLCNDMNYGKNEYAHDSTAWKIHNATDLQIEGWEHNKIVLVDDYLSVCQAAANAGYWAILVAKPHNYPGNEEIDLPFTPRKDMVIYRQQPGIIQINSLDELPFAFEMIRRQNLTGKKEGRWAIQEKL